MYLYHKPAGILRVSLTSVTMRIQFQPVAFSILIMNTYFYGNDHRYVIDALEINKVRITALPYFTASCREFLI